MKSVSRVAKFRSLAVTLAVTSSVALLAEGGQGDEPGGDGFKHTNQLVGSTSPYLLQHVHNPVNWYPWGDAAFEKAKKEDKPIFLSIGYAACHWCHVMERESFENETIAAMLNEHFVSIKVDREERPDVDEVYMAATVAMTGRGGWPMTIFMTPDREPFECGTYFPPESRGRRRGLRGLGEEIARKWRDDRQSLLDNAGSLVQKVRNRKRTPRGLAIIDRATISSHVERTSAGFDPRLGGRRSNGNKFPPTMSMELMLREYATQREVSKPYLAELVETTLSKMADGGIYDQIGGGICRYSTDPRWFAPHFEKMLYDQGTVSGLYLSTYQLTKDEKYARVARGILDYCIADLQDANGGFYSSRDADSEGEEGTFYVWTASEIDELLGEEDAPLFKDYYNVRTSGNWHRGKNILHVSTTPAAFAAKHGMAVDEWEQRLGSMKQTVFTARAKREPPGLDDKILAEWNGLIITSLARAYRILDEPRYRVAAERAASFILDEMVKDGRLYRAHRRGTTHIRGYASDYTSVIEALITLYETTFDRKWLSAADELNATLVKYFRDRQNGGFFYTAQDAEALLVRSKNARDGVVPSASSTAALNLMRLAILLGRPDLRELAEETLRSMESGLKRGGLHRMQWAAIFYHDHPKEVAIIGNPDDPATQALIAEVYRDYLPNKVVASCTPAETASDAALPLLKRKTLVKGKPGAYVCRDYVCGRPVNTPNDLRRQLDAVAPAP